MYELQMCMQSQEIAFTYYEYYLAILTVDRQLVWKKQASHLLPAKSPKKLLKNIHKRNKMIKIRMFLQRKKVLVGAELNQIKLVHPKSSD